MSDSSSLLKSILHNSIAEGLYNEIVNRTARYYYFLGKTLSWEDELVPPLPIDSFNYELSTRSEIITMKEIKPTDVAFVIPRYNWVSNTVFDMYDDQYSTEVQGINLISGGVGYGSDPNVYIGSLGSVSWSSNSAVFEGTFLKTPADGGFLYYIVTIGGTTGTTAPTHTDAVQTNGSASLLHVNVSDGSGSGAEAVATVIDGKVIDVQLTSRGIGYLSAPSVILAGGAGSGAIANSVVTFAPSGSQKLENSKYYVITDEFNVYTCLDNNNGAISDYKPIGTTVDPVSFPDGYMWKFMYSIPIALRTKFLTDEYLPVVTALRDQFYSNGNIQNTRIDQAGSGYTSGTITVQGDGYLEADPLYLISATIGFGGADYTTASITIDPPYTNTTPWTANISLFLGQKIIHNNNVYEVAVAGTTSSVGPVHRYSIVSNGTAALKYIGTVPTGTVTVSGGAITAVSINGMLREVDITTGGSGYTSAPTVNFSGGGGTNATAVAVLANGSVIRVIITNGGDNFTSNPIVTFGTQWTASTAVTIGQQIYHLNRLYTVALSGTTGTTAPTHLSGSAANGTASLTYVGTPATANVSIKYGAGYSFLPAITITGDGTNGSVYFSGIKSAAKLVPTFENGQLIGVQIDDGGVGYTFSTINISGDGTGAEISADLSPGDVNSLQANIELLTVDGRIMSIPVISGGWGYAAATVTIEGDGIGAEAVAVITNGYISKITMTNYGSGYRWAKVTIGGNGNGAKARAVITPWGGHGKYALNNLFAQTLMFYSNISGDKNQGFDVNNDFRQLGIIKNPSQYGNTYNLTSITASGCWVISGVISTTFFPADSLIVEIATGKRFRIVTNNGDAILAQSLDNFVPTIGTTFINEGNFTFSASAVSPPTADKYSGDLLFIDNKQAFTPTADQSVTLRTVIRF